VNDQPEAEKGSSEAARTARASTPGPRDERGVLAADVDPALVYHYYGSKENLLDVATTPPQSFLDQIVIAWQTPSAELGEQLVRQMLRNWQNPEHEPILRAVMQIAGSEPAIREKLRRIIQGSVMGPSAQALTEDERALRSGFIAAQLMGLAFMRFVWKIEPLASLDDDAVVTVIAPTIQRYLDGDLYTASREASPD